MSRRPPAGAVTFVVIALLAVVLIGGLVLVITKPNTPREASNGDAAVASPTAAATPRVTAAPVPGHEVYGYVPYWEMEGDIAEHVARTRLTTLGLFSVTHTRSGELDAGQTGFERITGNVGRRLARAAQDAGARVELVYTSFGEAKNRRFFDDDTAQAITIAALVDLAAELGLDGLNVDVESLPGDDIGAYGRFVGRLRDALRERIGDGTVSVATSSGPRGAAMAAVALAAGVDRVFVMGYDYHWSGSAPGASAPLGRLGEDRDLPTTLDLYAGAGVPVDRTILGLPLYGMAWPVEGPELDALNTGRGDAWIPSDHLAILRDPDLAPSRDDVQVVERLLLQTGDGWQAIYYDSPATLAPKLALANERGLAGAGFWALGYERGLPGYTDLIRRFASGEVLAGE